MIDESTLLFVRELADEFPAVHALLEEHKRDNFDEILPHVFMGTLTFYLAESIPQAQKDAEILSFIRRVLHRLEQEYVSGSPEVRSLLDLSFLENLPYPDETGAEIREMLGPALRAKFDLIQ